MCRRYSAVIEAMTTIAGREKNHPTPTIWNMNRKDAISPTPPWRFRVLWDAKKNKIPAQHRNSKSSRPGVCSKS